MQDRIKVKKIFRGVAVKNAPVVKDPLDVDWLIEQAKAQVKRQRDIIRKDKLSKR